MIVEMIKKKKKTSKSKQNAFMYLALELQMIPGFLSTNSIELMRLFYDKEFKKLVIGWAVRKKKKKKAGWRL